MDEDLKDLLICINENLKSIAMDQVVLYCRVQAIEEELQHDKKSQ